MATKSYTVLIYKRACDESNQIAIVRENQIKLTISDEEIKKSEILAKFEIMGRPNEVKPFLFMEAIEALDDAAGSVQLWWTLQQIVLQTWEGARS